MASITILGKIYKLTDSLLGGFANFHIKAIIIFVFAWRLVFCLEVLVIPKDWVVAIMMGGAEILSSITVLVVVRIGIRKAAAALLAELVAMYPIVEFLAFNIDRIITLIRFDTANLGVPVLSMRRIPHD